MRPLSRTVDEGQGEILQSPWPAMDELVEVRRGDSVLVQAAPMGNKSNLMLNWLLQNKIPAIYGTFDTPVIDMTARSLAILSGHTVNQVMNGLRSSVYDELAESQYSLWFTDDAECLDPNREGLTTLDELAVAYEEFLGEPPQVIVLDNLSDVAGAVERVALQGALKAARDLGRRLNAAVFSLHHVRRADRDEKDPGAVPVRLNDGVEAGERDATTVLGLWKPKMYNGSALRVANLKSKRQPADASGGLYKDFSLNQEHAWIGNEVS